MHSPTQVYLGELVPVLKFVAISAGWVFVCCMGYLGWDKWQSKKPR